MLESQLELIASNSRIETNQQRDSERLTRLEIKVDNHIEDCRQPKRSIFSAEALKEKWTLWVLLLQVGWTAVLMIAGQPDKAEKVWASSPAFRQQERPQD